MLMEIGTWVGQRILKWGLIKDFHEKVKLFDYTFFLCVSLIDTHAHYVLYIMKKILDLNMNQIHMYGTLK